MQAQLHWAARVLVVRGHLMRNEGLGVHGFRFALLVLMQRMRPQSSK